MDLATPATRAGNPNGPTWIPQFYDGPSDLEGLSPEERDRCVEQHLKHVGPDLFLCNVCQSMFADRPMMELEIGRPLAELKQNLVELHLSAVNGCHFCWFRWQQIQRAGQSNLSTTLNAQYAHKYLRPLGFMMKFKYPYLKGQESLRLNIILQPVQETKWTRYISALRRLEKGAMGVGSPKLHLLPTSNNSYASLCTVRMWIGDCLTNHKLCSNQVSSSRTLPTRIIDLGKTEQIRPKICLGTYLATETPYVSLSHCWGGKTFTRLMQSNLSIFKEEIPMGNLPKTFRDAMEVTKRLGIRYLWIDSLCIVQDSNEDWGHEAARMGDVYRFALFNIAATRARDGSVGCFAERSLMEVEPCRVDHQTASYFCHDQHVTDYRLRQAPLMERAWVVQEIALAPRVVHLAETQIFWECLERQASETCPDQLLDDRGLQWNNAMGMLRNEQDWDRPSLERLAYWGKLVGNYSGADLTYRTKDKLIALSGLARTVGPSSQYVAGLWKSELAYSLGWKTDQSKGHPASRALEYRAPTWSWASIDGPVELNEYNTSMRAPDIAVNFLDVHIQPLGDDPYGQIEMAFLRIQGPLVFCKLVVKANDHERMYLDGTVHCTISMDEGEARDGDMLYCCPLVLGQYSGASGLLLMPTYIKGQYIRCGYFNIQDRERPPRHFKQWCCFSPMNRDIPPELYEGLVEPTTDGYAQYIFTIV